MNANPGSLISIEREGKAVVEAVAAERLIEAMRKRYVIRL